LNEVLVHLSATRAPLAPEGARVQAAPLRFDCLDDAVVAPQESQAA
jgi:hypothetical protein